MAAAAAAAAAGPAVAAAEEAYPWRVDTAPGGGCTNKWDAVWEKTYVSLLQFRGGEALSLPGVLSLFVADTGAATAYAVALAPHLAVTACLASLRLVDARALNTLRDEVDGGLGRWARLRAAPLADLPLRALAARHAALGWRRELAAAGILTADGADLLAGCIAAADAHDADDALTQLGKCLVEDFMPTVLDVLVCQSRSDAVALARLHSEYTLDALRDRLHAGSKEKLGDDTGREQGRHLDYMSGKAAPDHDDDVVCRYLPMPTLPLLLHSTTRAYCVQTPFSHIGLRRPAASVTGLLAGLDAAMGPTELPTAASPLPIMLHPLSSRSSSCCSRSSTTGSRAADSSTRTGSVAGSKRGRRAATPKADAIVPTTAASTVVVPTAPGSGGGGGGAGRSGGGGGGGGGGAGGGGGGGGSRGGGAKRARHHATVTVAAAAAAAAAAAPKPSDVAEHKWRAVWRWAVDTGGVVPGTVCTLRVARRTGTAHSTLTGTVTAGGSIAEAGGMQFDSPYAWLKARQTAAGKQNLANDLHMTRAGGEVRYSSLRAAERAWTAAKRPGLRPVRASAATAAPPPPHRAAVTAFRPPERSRLARELAWSMNP